MKIVKEINIHTLWDECMKLPIEVIEEYFSPSVVSIIKLCKIDNVKAINDNPFWDEIAKLPIEEIDNKFSTLTAEALKIHKEFLEKNKN